MISIIVVTWNSDKYLAACLGSVKEQSEKDIELIVVDNNSSDNSKNIIKQYKPEIFIENSDNLGFAKANNQGIKVSKGEYVLTLNMDVILELDYLEKIKQEIVKDEKIGMVSGKLMRPARAGKPSGEIDSEGIYLSPIRKFFDIGQEKSGIISSTHRLIGPCAAAGFYRRTMLEDIKIEDEYFDEDFFAYVEDVDLAWRAERAGWRAIYCPSAKAIHLRGGSKIDPKWKKYISYRNRYLMMIKNEDIGHLMRYILSFLLYDIPRMCYLLISNKYVLSNYKEFPILISNAWRKRKLIRKK